LEKFRGNAKLTLAITNTSCQESGFLVCYAENYITISSAARKELCGLAVLFYDSEALDNEVEPSAGELRLSGRLVGYSNYTQLAKGVLPCSSQCIATYRGRLNSIQCVPSGIVGATHYKVTVIAEDQ
jgi:hypothetical protein